MAALAHRLSGKHRVLDPLEKRRGGCLSPKDPDSLVFSRVPVDATPIAWMHCNLDAFKAHCRAHRDYWQWIAERNKERYATNAAHGRGYDSKNLMHTIRLLEMAGEIADEGILRVRRPNRGFLLEIRSGRYNYEELVAHADSLHAGLTERFARSPLPDAPDRSAVNALLLEIRIHVAAATRIGRGWFYRGFGFLDSRMNPPGRIRNRGAQPRRRSSIAGP